MKQIVEFFKKCPEMVAVTLREDYLAPGSGSAAIVADGGEQVLRRYTSGDILGQYNFKLLVRENFTGGIEKLFTGLSDWLEHGKEKLPGMSGNKTAEYIEVAKGPALIKTEVGAGIYEMKFRLVYYRKGESL